MESGSDTFYVLLHKGRSACYKGKIKGKKKVKEREKKVLHALIVSGIKLIVSRTQTGPVSFLTCTFSTGLQFSVPTLKPFLVMGYDSQFITPPLFLKRINLEQLLQDPDETLS